MSWVRLDDLFPEHPKILALSAGAFRVHVRGICYCSRLLTDGFVPKYISTEWGKRYVDELVALQVWDVTEEGHFIHDYLDYNPSRMEVEGRKDSDRKRKGIQAESERKSLGIPGGIGDVLGSGGSSQARCFEDFWNAYPRREGKRAAQKAFVAALGRAQADEILAGAARYRDDPNREPQYTAHPSTWLNRDGWNDAPLPSRNGSSTAQRLMREAVENR